MVTGAEHGTGNELRLDEPLKSLQVPAKGAFGAIVARVEGFRVAGGASIAMLAGHSARSSSENDMVIRTVGPLAFALAVTAVPASAQGIIPIISPGQAAEGIFSRSRSETDARRPRDDDQAQPETTASPSSTASGHPEPGTPEFQKQACDNRPIYRRQYGENDPQVQKLEAMCRAQGY